MIVKLERHRQRRGEEEEEMEQGVRVRNECENEMHKYNNRHDIELGGEISNELSMDLVCIFTVYLYTQRHTHTHTRRDVFNTHRHR